MAVLKLETVVAMSEDWQITHAPLLRWKAKLKRVLKEGKDIVRTHRRNNTTLEWMRSNSLPRRMAQVAMRFMPFSRGSTSHADDDLTDSAVRQFERIAEGTDEYLEFVRCGGGRPRILTFLPSFARSVAAGERTEFLLRMEGGTAMYACFVRAVKDSVKTLHLIEALMTRRADERQRIWEAHLSDKTMDWAEAQS
ncbi:unnamed protein product [Alopecurus aequalis]